MEYSKNYVAKDEPIDVQEIMDGLYYPFYMEYCRHDYIREVLGFDFETEAKNGVFMVLSNYSISFLRSLKKATSLRLPANCLPTAPVPRNCILNNQSS